MRTLTDPTTSIGVDAGSLTAWLDRRDDDVSIDVRSSTGLAREKEDR